MCSPHGLLKCYRCHEIKPAGDFAWRRKHRNQRDFFCRPCRSEYKREHYLKNKQRYIAQAAVRKTKLLWERVALVIEYFKAHPCADCGEDDPLVLEFDHLRDKEFDIATSLHYRSWQTISTRSPNARWCARTATGAAPTTAPGQ